MKSRSRNHLAFTLLELVVVLGILAVVTGLAVRALDRVEDQRRFENAQRGLEEIEAAVLGSPDDRAVDGTRTISGFVADMGRLPRTTEEEGVLTLSELWKPSGAPYNVRPAIEAHGVPASMQDFQVLVPGGWRGPYVRLPLGAQTLLDAWGNPMISPATATPSNPDTTGYARLRDATDSPITAAGQEIRIIRHLGADGRSDSAGVSGYDKDRTLELTNDRFRATLAGHVEVLDGDSPATSDSSDPDALIGNVVIRVFGPNPGNPALISVSSVTIPFSANPVTWPLPPATLETTIGPRVVRAYFEGTKKGNPISLASAVKQVTLRPGTNFVELTVDRPKPPTP